MLLQNLRRSSLQLWKGRLSSLETKIPHLLNKIDAREVEIKHLKSDNEELNDRLRWINEENFTKTREIDKLSAEIVENQLNLQDKQQTLDSLELKLEQTQRHLNSEGHMNIFKEEPRP